MTNGCKENPFQLLVWYCMSLVKDLWLPAVWVYVGKAGKEISLRQRLVAGLQFVCILLLGWALERVDMLLKGDT